jgi:hypothetical protein
MPWAILAVIRGRNALRRRKLFISFPRREYTSSPK